MKKIVIDLTKCIGCCNCQLACKDEHVGNDWSPISKPQPERHRWMNVHETERGTRPKVVVNWMPVMCMHCQQASCITRCPDNAVYRRDDGAVIIDPEKCTGCEECMNVCPYGAIYLNTELGICQKCTLCSHLIDQGWKEPRCVTACPTEALIYGQADELSELAARAEDWKPETGSKPLVAYIGLPKPFIAGEVYSPNEDACIEGASVTATDLLTGEQVSVTTNNYGDFWLKGLRGTRYSMIIDKEGYYLKQIHNILPQDGQNLGSIKLYRRNSPAQG